MKNVYIPAGGRGLGSELREQLRIFGITVREVEGVSEAARLSSAGDVGVFLVDAERIDREPLFISELSRLKEGLGASLRLIFYGESDNFDFRLKSLRAGGEAFFQLPVDAARLVDKIDSLFGEAEPYRILIVDDDPEQLAYHAALLTRVGMVVATTTEAAEAIPLVVETKPDVLLVDMYMPRCSGSELAGLLRQYEAFGSIPIIFLSVEKDSEKQIAAIRRGGDEFLEKPVKPELLVGAIIARAERRRMMRGYMERDYLTGLLNHTTLTERLSNEVLRARRSGSILSFAKINIDGLKLANERYGHLSGDHILRSLARLLAERLRRTDIVGRYSGQDFGVILPGADGRCAARLIDELRESFGSLSHRFEGQVFSLTLSAGISSYPDFVGSEDLTEAADRGLRKAKDCGRDKVVVESSSS